jgi:hypothetical protein
MQCVFKLSENQYAWCPPPTVRADEIGGVIVAGPYHTCYCCDHLDMCVTVAIIHIGL